jgi:hypothetical protein
VRDDALMDLYYGRMHEEYAAGSHTYPKDVLKTLTKVMKASFFLNSTFEVEFPVDGSKPPPKHPYSICRNNLLDSHGDLRSDPENGNTFVKTPGKKEQPTRREQSKCVDAITSS